MNVKIALRGGVLLASLVLIVVLIRTLGLDEVLDETWIDHYVRGQGASGMMIFIAAGGFFTAIGLPRQLIGFLGGYAFDVSTGTGVAVAAAVVGCAVTFYYARFLGRDIVASRFPGKVKRVDDFLSENPFSMTLLIRFLPIGSNLITNLAAGVSRVSGPAFIAGSAVGYIPQTLIFALIGAGIKVDPATNIAVAVCLFIFSGILGVYLYRRYRRSRILDDAIERDLEPSETP